MKKVFIILSFVVMLISACGHSSDDQKVDNITIDRYDRIESRYLTTGDFAALQTMNTDYTMQTRTLIEDVIKLGSVNDPDINRNLLEYYQDSLLQKVISEVQVQYTKMDDITEQLKGAFRNLLKEIPDSPVPSFYTQITALDQSIVVDGTSIGISLDKYLGEDFPIYQKFYTADQRRSMSREFIVPDVMVFYLVSHYSISNFESRSQEELDTHMGIIMWIVNKLVGRQAFDDVNVKRVENYMKSHKDITIRQLLEQKDYINIK